MEWPLRSENRDGAWRGYLTDHPQSHIVLPAYSKSLPVQEVSSERGKTQKTLRRSREVGSNQCLWVVGWSKKPTLSCNEGDMQTCFRIIYNVQEWCLVYRPNASRMRVNERKYKPQRGWAGHSKRSWSNWPLICNARSWMKGNFHVQFWNRGRGGNPAIDCNKF